jgi:hypothetical protein
VAQFGAALQGRARRAAHRASEEGRDGGKGARIAGWLPELLRTPGWAIDTTALGSEAGQIAAVGSVGEESAVIGYETAMADFEQPAEDQSVATEPLPDAAE